MIDGDAAALGVIRFSISMPSTCSTLLPTEQRISDVEAHLVVDFLIDVLIQEVLFQTGEQSTFREFVHNICPWYDADLSTDEYATEPPSWRALVFLNMCIACVGGPGSGKGTQCAKIVETFGYLHISAGEILRREIASKSADGTMILNRIKEGKIVPSEVTVKLIQKEMESGGNHKFLIDGFPRNDENRRAFEEIVGVEPDVVLFFDCPEEEMVKRVLNRNQGRVDDNYDTVVKRLKVFKRHNLPVIDYYATKGKLYKINAVGNEDEIFERVRPVFTSAWMPDNRNSP